MTPEELTARLAALGITRAEIARRLGVHAASLLRMANGQLNIPTYLVRGLENLEKLQQAGIAPAGGSEMRPDGRRRRQPGPAALPNWAEPTTNDGTTPRRKHNVTSLTSIVVGLADKLDLVERQLAQLGAQQATVTEPMTSGPHRISRPVGGTSAALR